MAENPIQSSITSSQQSLPQGEEIQEGHLGNTPVSHDMPNPTEAHEISDISQRQLITNSTLPHGTHPLSDAHSVDNVARNPSSLRANTVARSSLSEPQNPHFITKYEFQEIIDRCDVGKLKEIPIAHLLVLRDHGLDPLLHVMINVPQERNNFYEMLQIIASKMSHVINVPINDPGRFGDDTKTNYFAQALLNHCSVRTLEILMRCGADFLGKITDRTHILSSNRALDIIDVFMSGNPSLAEKHPIVLQNLLFKCVQLGNLDALKHLASKGIIFDVKDNEGNNLLHVACQNLRPNTLSLINFCLDHGVKINEINNANFQPLAVAILKTPIANQYEPYYEKIELLLEKGANLLSSSPKNYALTFVQSFTNADLDEERNYEILDRALILENRTVSNDPCVSTLLEQISNIPDRLKKHTIALRYFETMMDVNLVNIFRNLLSIADSNKIPEASIPMMLIAYQDIHSLRGASEVDIPHLDPKSITTLNTIIGKSYRNLAVTKPFVVLLTRFADIKAKATEDDTHTKKIFVNILRILCSESKDIATFSSTIQKFQIILDMDKHGLFENNNLQLNVIYSSTMLEFRNLFKMDDQEFENCMKIFQDARFFREPRFLTVWPARLYTIESTEEKLNVFHLLSQFLLTVMKENCITSTSPDGTRSISYDPTKPRTSRYDISDEGSVTQKHLRAVFETRPALLNEWKKGAEYDFVTFVEQHFYPPVVISDFLIKHIDSVNLPLLKEYMTVTKERKEALRTELANILKSKPPNRSILTIQHLLMSFFSESKFNGSPEEIGKMKQILKFLQNEVTTKDSTFTAEWEKQIENSFSKKEYEDWKVVDTDSVHDILMMGNEMFDSCQAMDREPAYNQCILGAEMDGKIRLVGIKNKDNVLVTRALMRIFLDQPNSSGAPHLFMEKRYKGLGDNRLTEKVLVQMFKVRAEALKLPLHMLNSANLPSYNVQLYCLGGPAPEYVDALQRSVNNLDDRSYDLPSKPVV